MSVAQHLKIKLSEYDERIRTFIPNYEEMLDEVAATVALFGKKQPTIVDLGIGTGALAARCLAISPQARVVGIDSDADILALARRRLSQKRAQQPTLIQGNFLENALPRCDAIVATLALHHIAEAKTKQRFYAQCFAALRRGGIFANGDCFMAENAKLSQRYMEIWQRHLRRFYSLRQAQSFFTTWADEDTYFPLAQELVMLKAVGFEVEVVWRRAPFAVVMGRKS
ncbi:methyltransferase domain-containing protein [candidate division KSB1 bacterium]|nr:methyltransferase domain-containing protein [candidate division KSB1 bacterium]